MTGHELEFSPDETDTILEAVILLPSWAAMGTAVDYPRFRHMPQDGSMVVGIVAQDRGVEPLTPAERAIVDQVLADNERLRQSLLTATFSRYAGLQEEYGYDDGDEADSLMPDVPTPDGLAPLIRPIKLHIHLRTRDGEPYVGIEAQSQWDQEHGLGLLLNGDRTVEFGAGDVAWSDWKVDDDLASEPGTD